MDILNKEIRKLLNRFGHQILPNASIPLSQYSIIIPTESWKSTANERLLDISLQAIQYARQSDLTEIANRMIERPLWPIIWPGEHYRLLCGLVKAINAKIVVEIGTATGYSALAIKSHLPPDGKIYSFDIVPWKSFPNCVLKESDFVDSRLEQIIADLSDRATFEKHKTTLSKADFIFIDAAKDGIQEQVFLDHFDTIEFKSNPIFMFDDIRLMNMISIWNNIKRPKLDITSFGHWSGTGLVDWLGRNDIKS